MHGSTVATSSVGAGMLATLVAQGGCAWLQLSGRNRRRRSLPPGAGLEQVIAAVNQQQLANPVPVQRFGHAQRTGLSDAAGPHRLSAAAQLPPQGRYGLTGPEVDLGSNDQFFWFWIKRSQPPAVYFCRHDQFPTSQGAADDPHRSQLADRGPGHAGNRSRRCRTRVPIRTKGNRIQIRTRPANARGTEHEGHDHRCGQRVGDGAADLRRPRAAAGALGGRGIIAAIRGRGCTFPRPCRWSVPRRSSRCASTSARCKSTSCRAIRPSCGPCPAIPVRRVGLACAKSALCSPWTLCRFCSTMRLGEHARKGGSKCRIPVA